MGIRLGSLKPRQRGGSKVKDRWRTRRGSQSSPQARVRKFESLELESLKSREFESLKVRKVESSKSFNLWGVEGFKFSNFENLKIGETWSSNV